MATTDNIDVKKGKDKGQGQELRQSGSESYQSPFNEIERAFDEYLGGGWLQPFRLQWPSWAERARTLDLKTPRIDVLDQDDQIIVNAEIPGVKKENLEVTLSNNTLTIRGKTRKKAEEKQGDYIRREISSGEVSRTVLLPSDVDESGAKATFRDGVLELMLPKLQKTKRHKIDIQG
jgi:HSP20 family protein